jgi:hypothetical protein
MIDSGTILFLCLFPFFVAMWLLITTMVGAMSGWFTLRRRYPAGTEQALVTFRRRTGLLGKKGVGMGSALALGACPSGLRIAISRMAGPFQRPILIPWDEIVAEPKTMLFVPMAELRLGIPQIGTIVIDAHLWEDLSVYSPERARASDRFVPISNRQLGQGMALQWAALATGVAVFFNFGFLLMSGPSAPWALRLGAGVVVPALLFGIPQLIRYAMQRHRA